jgi:hypothetical protein
MVTALLVRAIMSRSSPADKTRASVPGGGAVKVGDLVVHKGRLCVLRGVDPASVVPRCAQLEDAETREKFWVAFEELRSNEQRPARRR